MEAPKNKNMIKAVKKAEKQSNREDEGEEYQRKIQAARMEAAARAKQISDRKEREKTKVERRKQMKNGRRRRMVGRSTHNDDDDDDDDDDHTKKRDDDRQRGRRTSFSSRFFSMLSYVMRTLPRAARVSCSCGPRRCRSIRFEDMCSPPHTAAPLVAKRARSLLPMEVFLPGVPPSLNAKDSTEIEKQATGRWLMPSP